MFKASFWKKIRELCETSFGNSLLILLGTETLCEGYPGFAELENRREFLSHKIKSIYPSLLWKARDCGYWCFW